MPHRGSVPFPHHTRPPNRATITICAMRTFTATTPGPNRLSKTDKKEGTPTRIACTLLMGICPAKLLPGKDFSRAGDETRTRDIQLGNVEHLTQTPRNSVLAISIFSKSSRASQGFLDTILDSATG